MSPTYFVRQQYFTNCYILFAALLPSTVCVAMARVGADDQKIVVANLRHLTSIDMGTPLHSLVIPGNMHPIELDMLKLFAMDHSIKEQLSVLASASCSHQHKPVNSQPDSYRKIWTFWWDKYNWQDLRCNICGVIFYVRHTS